MNEIQVAEMVGMRFGKLTIVQFSHINKHRSACYLCRCDCGAEKVVNRNDLRSGRTRSCGCLVRERCAGSVGRSNGNFKHGGSGTKLIRVWRGMRERCSNPNHISYRYYGGKGISVCEGWSNFESFRSWAIANGYQDGLSIDRIDSSKGYSPENCEWVTRSENTARGNKNRRVSNG